MGFFRIITTLWHQRSNSAYISFLRKKGVEVGEHVLFRDRRTTMIDLTRPALVSIGDNVDINRHFQILTHDWGCFVIRGKYNDFVNSSGRVIIGNNVYFGTDVIILKGVTIGDNCIIGAGSVVSRSIPANSVATGNPCRVVCSLDEYYEKRKERGLAEAVEYVQAYRKRFGRDPHPQEMTEEFIYFVNKENAEKYEEIGVPVKRQLQSAYDTWLMSHQSKFKSVADFMAYVDEQS